MSSIFYTIAFAILIYVTKAGWKDTSPVVTAILICCTSIATFFFGLTTIFKQEQNANKNLELYLAHINLEQEMRSRISRSDYLLKFHDQECSQLLNTFKKETKTVDSLISYFDAEMGKINKIELGFDAAGITKLRSELEASKPKP